jgi:endonuclease V-like protein UPF0215 family
MHIAKKGLRVLGIAESFSAGKNSILAGVVMRKDLRIDGLSFTTTTVGGMDATDSVIALYKGFTREDINLVMIGGGVISWYNIIDPFRVYHETQRGTIIVTYEESDGIEGDIAHHFPGDKERIEAYRNLGGRTPVTLHSEHTMYIRSYGLSEKDAAVVCSDFTYDGRVPEPLRVARLYARSVMRSILQE